MAVPYSVLDLAPIVAGATASDAYRNTLDLARHAERLGYRRYWLAEHHGMAGVGSASPAVLIAHVAAGTTTIRVGSGGVMLPNHAPLVVAEQFATLASLYPGRIDLGIGRAPGADHATMRALRRDPMAGIEDFPADLRELCDYFSGGTAVRAVPGAGVDVPIWLLGSSTYSAQLAAALGLPFAFASHFAPDHLMAALDLYRTRFRPGALDAPCAMAVVNVFAADSDAEGRRMFTSLQQAFVNIRQGRSTPLAPPLDEGDVRWSPMERLAIDHALQYSFLGSRDTVRRGLERFLALTGVDELMIAGHMHDHEARVRSYTIAAEIVSSMRPATVTTPLNV